MAKSPFNAPALGAPMPEVVAVQKPTSAECKSAAVSCFERMIAAMKSELAVLPDAAGDPAIGIVRNQIAFTITQFEYNMQVVPTLEA